MESNVIMVSSKKARRTHLSAFDKRILTNVALRVSDSPQCQVKKGIPCTDGRTIFLPFDDPSLTFDDLEGLAAHEGGHIRFKSVIDPKLAKDIYPENPELGHFLMNICEDARIETLLAETFPGFWDELDVLNLRMLIKTLPTLTQFPLDQLKTPAALKILLQLMSFEGCSHSELIFASELCQKGQFIFASEEMGRFWTAIKNAMAFIRNEKTFPATMIAARRLLNAIKEYVGPELSHLDKKSPPKKDPLKKSESAFSGQPKDKPHTSPLKSEILKEGEESGPKSDTKAKNQSLSSSLEEAFKKSKKYLRKPSNSGIPLKNFKKDTQKTIQQLQKALKGAVLRSEKEIETFLHDHSKIFLKSREEIEIAIQELRGTSRPTRKFTAKPEVIITDGKKRLIHHHFRAKAQIQHINRVSNPKQIYQNIVLKYARVIHNLKIKFFVIKKSLIMERGQRRGFISGRDLAQVRASRGQFKSPFKNYHSGKGARLIILIDESGSMNGKRIAVAKEAAIILTESLKETRISFAIIGFGAKGGKKDICEKIYKDLDEPVDPEKIGAIGIASGYIENRDGDSIRKAVETHFHTKDNSTPILLILSDGQPHHGGTAYTGPRGIEDTRQAIVETRRKGVNVFAISIDTSRSSYLSTIYHQNQYIVVNSLNKLPEELMKLVSHIARALSH